MKGSSDSTLVRNGEESAEVIVELADETVIRRRLSSQGKQSVTVTKGEFLTRSPQEMLNGLFSASSFNPIALLDPKARHDAIMSSIDLKITADQLGKMLGVLPETLPPLNYDKHGLTVLDEAYKFFYQRRAEANRDAEEKANRFRAFESDLKATPEVTLPMTREQVQAEGDRLNESLVATERELAMAKGYQDQITSARERYEHLGRKAASDIEQIARLKKEIVKLEESVAEHKAQGQQIVIDAEALKAKLVGTENLLKVRDEIKEKIGELRVTSSSFDLYESRKRLAEKVEAMKSEASKAKDMADSLSAKVQMISKDVKAKVMSDVEMPIAGLEYSNGEFLVNGIRVDHLSSSQAMVMAVKIARKLAKKTKVICVDGAEMLDAESFKALHDEIKDDGYTYFVSKVGDAFETNDNVITMQHGQVLQ